MPHRNDNRRLKIALLATVAVFWGLVVADTAFPLPVILHALKGAEAEAPAPVWSLQALRSGTTVTAISKWFDARIGLRSFWVRLDNQIDYTFFNQVVDRSDGTRLVRAPGDWFYERQYIEYATSKSSISEDEFRQRIERMRRVEEKLARRGIPLLYVVAPSKAAIYPEHVPAELFRKNPPEQTTTSWEIASGLLPGSGVSYIDGPALYDRWKREGAPDLFARSGTHWSYSSTLRIWELIRAALNPRLKHPIPAFAELPSSPGRPRGNDRDLLDLANLLWPKPYEHPLAKPVLRSQKEVPAERLPRILWIHDIFGWVLIEELYEANAARPSDSLYYFATKMRIPGGVASDQKIAAIDWPSFLRDYDAIVLVWTEIAFEFDSCGFYEALDKALD